MRNLREAYLTFTKRRLMSKPEVVDYMFRALIEHFDINVLKSSPTFMEMAQAVIANPSAENTLLNCLAGIIEKRRFDTLDFLVIHCGYRLTDNLLRILLHTSCMLGSAQGIMFALNAGANPNAENAAGLMPLHLLVLYKKDAFCIEILCRKGANLDAQDEENGLSALYMAYALNHKTAIKMLSKLGARTDLPTKLGPRNYKEWCEAVKKNEEFKIKVLTKPAYTSDSCMVRAYHALLLSTFNQGNIEKVKVDLWKRTNDKDVDLLFINLLLSCHLVTTSFHATSIIKFVKELFKSSDISRAAVVSEVFEGIVDFLKTQLIQVPLREIEQLIIFLVSIIDIEASSLDDKTLCFHHAVVGYNALGLLQQGERLAIQTLALFTKEVEQTEQRKPYHHSLFYDLGLNQFWQMKDLDALASFRSGYALAPTNSPLYAMFVATLQLTGQHAEAVSVGRQAVVGQLATLQADIIDSKTANGSSAELIEKIKQLEGTEPSCTAEEYGATLVLIASYYWKLGRSDDAIFAIKKRFKISEKSCQQANTDIALSIYNCLASFLTFGFYDAALAFVTEYKVKFPIVFNYPRFKSLETLLCLAAGELVTAEKLVRELTGTSDPKKQAELYRLLAVYTCQGDTFNVEQANCAIAFLDEALLRYPDDEQAKYIKFLLVSGLKQASAAQQIATELTDDASLTRLAMQENLLDTTSVVTPDEKIEESTTEKECVTDIHNSSAEAALTIKPAIYDPIKINRYIERQQKQLLHSAVAKIAGLDHRASWIIDGAVYQEGADGMVKIDSIFYKNYYCVLQPGLFKDLAAEKRAQAAIAGGLCQRRRGTTGMIATETCWFAKLHKDLCIVATEVYENTSGQRLIVLNQMRNHPAKNILLEYKKKMEVKLCTEQPRQEHNTQRSSATTMQTTYPPVSNFFPPVGGTASITQPAQSSPPSNTGQAIAVINSTDGSANQNTGPNG